MIKKEIQYQGLDKLPVLIEDKSPDSSFYFRLKDIPSELTGGKNLIKIRLSSYLRDSSGIQFEILDYNGNPIYYEFTDYLAKDGESRVISIWIYDDAPPGLATMYLVGTATRTPENAPISRQQSAEPNLRWTKQIQIVPDKRNSTPILFNTSPSASVVEIISPYLKRTFSGGSKDQTYSTGQISYQLIGGSSTAQLTSGAFPNSIEGGTLTVASPVDPTPNTGGTPVGTTYKTKIKKLLDPYNILLSSPYEVQVQNSNIPIRYGQFEPSAYNIDYEEFPTYVATQNSWSYANIALNGVNPLTGDVYRIKTSRRGPGLIADWEQVDDSVLEASEILEATSSLYTKTKIGYLTSTSFMNEYWQLDNSDTTTGTALLYTTAPLMNCMILYPSPSHIPVGETKRVETKKKFKFQKGGQYIFKFNAYSRIVDSQDKFTKLNVYLSGSSFNWKGVDSKIGLRRGGTICRGKKIATLENTDLTKRYSSYQIDFEADQTGTGQLVMESERGTWYFAEIGIKSSQETGFTPNNFKVIVPIETKMLNDEVDFKFEYFDYLGNQSNHTTYVLDKKFVGGNTYIDGANNLLTGSMFIGRAFGQGIEQSGRSSGLIKSTGYEGFYEASASRDDPDAGPPGFMIWSGSAKPGGALTTYQGVGIEAIADSGSYFRYTTDPSQLDIRTEKFFLGGENMYISGSNGIMRISSSFFEVDPTGLIIAETAIFRGIARAEALNWRNYTVTSSLDPILYPWSNGGGEDYYALNLDLDNGGVAAQFIRINDNALDRPIAGILSTYGTNYGTFIVIEAGSGSPFYLTKLENPFSNTDERIGADVGDWAHSCFSVDFQPSSFLYVNQYHVLVGDRVQLYRGNTDWKIQATTAYGSGPITIKEGIILTDGNPPTLSTDPGVVGQQAWDQDYYYVCVGPGVNTWKRTPLSTW